MGGFYLAIVSEQQTVARRPPIAANTISAARPLIGGEPVRRPMVWPHHVIFLAYKIARDEAGDRNCAGKYGETLVPARPFS